MASNVSGPLLLLKAFRDRVSWTTLPKNLIATAHIVENAIVHGRQIPVLPKEENFQTQADAYSLSAVNCALRINAGRAPVGRKIGFTNTALWTRYEPAWGYLYDKSISGLSAARTSPMWLSTRALRLEPKIEPEIVLCLKATPRSDMTEQEVLACIEWIAPGYEIVTSLFKDWDFDLASAIATNTLHDHLYIGQKRYIQEEDLDILPDQLTNFAVDLYRNKKLVATGSGSNVLGSPLKALLHLCTMLENQDLHPGLCPGEIISTGTLTDAMPMEPQKNWASVYRGIDLHTLDLPVWKVPKVRENSAQPGNTSRAFKRVVLETPGHTTGHD